MEPFTYKDYLYYKNKKVKSIEDMISISKEFYNKIFEVFEESYSKEKMAVGTLQEEEEKYIMDNKMLQIVKSKIQQPHDKTYKIILSNKKEVARLINRALKIMDKKCQIKENEIEKYNRSFITKSLKNRESDITYRIKGKNIFFLIEQQTKKDYEMPYRILEYCMLIMDEEIDRKKAKRKGYKYPKVYPIILYTGDAEWRGIERIEERQEKIEGVEEKEFSQYTLIDINKFTKEELLREEGILSKVLVLEKSKTEEEIIEDLKEISKTKMTEEEKEILKMVVYKIFAKDIGREKIEEIMEKLEKREDKEMVIEEVLKKSREREFKKGIIKGRREGILKGKREIIIEMLKNEIEDEIIMNLAKIDRNLLEEIKRNM